MKNEIHALVIIALIVAGVWYAYFSSKELRLTSPDVRVVATTSASSFMTKVALPDGMSFSYPEKDYRLAITSDKVLVLAYIPPCAEGFDYCLYRATGDFSGTNFESAGVRIKLRTDLTSKQACLTTSTAGRTNLTTRISEHGSYASSAFSVGDAAMGHYAAGTLYRLYASGNCTEFETSIGESQYANFPAGSIQRFTAADRARVQSELSSMLRSVNISGVPVVFPGLSS